MHDVRAVAEAVRDDDGVIAPVVLLEAMDGTLEVASVTGEVPDALRALVGSRLDDHVDGSDLPALRAARDVAIEQGLQRACLVRIGRGDEVAWFEARWLPGLVPDRTVVLLRDVTRVRRLAREGALLRRVTELANAGSDIGAVARQAVTDLRVTMGWRAGRVLEVVDDDVATATAWDVDEDARALADVLGDRSDVRASGVAVAAVARRGPVTSRDLPEDDWMSALVPAGVRKVIAIPILSGDDVVRVLEFLAGAGVVLDQDQRTLLAEVGRQLGSVAQREQHLRDVEASRAELARSNDELERFAYVASHDLQEPLRKIVGFAELLVEHREPQDDDERDFLDYIVSAAYRQQRLIKDLLAYSRAGRRELRSEPVALDDVVADVLADLGLAIEDAAATIDVEALPTVVGDVGQLRELLQNLVANSLKYRAEERAPVVRITATEGTEPGTVELVVADNGIGIDPVDRTSVLEVFRRLHAAHEYEGTGLGLALADRIVRRHGGTVTIHDSPLGHGVAVHCTLPTAET